MKIIIDEQIELMSVIQTLGNFWDNLWLRLFNKKLFQCEYKENVNNYFGKYKNHETINVWNELFAVAYGKADLEIRADGKKLKLTVWVSNPKLNTAWFLSIKGKTKQLTVKGKSGATAVTVSLLQPLYTPKPRDASIARLYSGQTHTKPYLPLRGNYGMLLMKNPGWTA